MYRYERVMYVAECVYVYIYMSTCVLGRIYVWMCVCFLSRALSPNLSSGPDTLPDPQC